MDYWKTVLTALVGGTIKKVLVNYGDGENWYGLAIKLADGRKMALWFLSDEEANAPGRFEVSEIEEKKND